MKKFQQIPSSQTGLYLTLVGEASNVQLLLARLKWFFNSSVTWVGASKKHPYVKTSTSRQTNNRVVSGARVSLHALFLCWVNWTNRFLIIATATPPTASFCWALSIRHELEVIDRWKHRHDRGLRPTCHWLLYPQSIHRCHEFFGCSRLLFILLSLNHRLSYADSRQRIS